MTSFAARLLSGAMSDLVWDVVVLHVTLLGEAVLDVRGMLLAVGLFLVDLLPYLLVSLLLYLLVARSSLMFDLKYLG